MTMHSFLLLLFLPEILSWLQQFSLLFHFFTSSHIPLLTLIQIHGLFPSIAIAYMFVFVYACIICWVCIMVPACIFSRFTDAEQNYWSVHFTALHLWCLGILVKQNIGERINTTIKRFLSLYPFFVLSL